MAENEILRLIYEELCEMKTQVEEMNRNAKIADAAQLDLSRRLDMALSDKSEREMIIARITKLEEEVSKIKKRLAEMGMV